MTRIWMCWEFYGKVETLEKNLIDEMPMKKAKKKIFAVIYSALLSMAALKLRRKSCKRINE